MRILNFVITFIILSVTSQISAYAQQDSIVLDSIVNKTKTVAEHRPVERVYIHFDKPYYSVADTIWFKAYVTMGENLPTQLSKIVYVDVINQRDSLVQTVKLPLVDGVADGSIPLLHGAYKQGNYYFKAYTLWMLNFDPAYLFGKNIAIGEAIDKQLTTNFSYKNTQTDKSQVIDAVVQFKNTDNGVIANKQVNWQVISNFDEVNKGRGTTDQNGFLKIKIDPRKNGPIINGELITNLNMSDKEVLTSSFVFKPTKDSYDVQFFPEGGELISGLATRVGFKSINTKELGVDIKGTITDNTGATITSFNSGHLGMGSFYLNADESKTYKANVTFKDGSVKSYDMPKALPSGVTLQVGNTDTAVLNVKILVNNAYFAANKDKVLFLIGTNGGIIYYAAKTKLNSQLINAKIPKDKFPSGIMQMTLFSETGDPVSERLAFNAPKASVNVSLKSDLPAYKPKQKVKMMVSAKNGSAPLSGNFSISVTDDQKVPVDEDSEVTIISSLLLTSDLKGYIEKPNYYFNKPDEKKFADLDVLMLTQGYRRFNYKEILANKFPAITQLMEQSMRISGTLRDRTGIPIKKGLLRLTVTGTRYGYEAATSQIGAFNFPNVTVPDSSEVVINAKYSANGSALMILLDAQPNIPVFKNPYPVDEITNIDSALAPYLSNSKKQYNFLRNLKEVKIEGVKVKKPSHSDYTSLVGLGNINLYTISGERFKACGIFADCLQTMATGLTFFQDNFYVTRDYQAGGRVPVQIFLNGSPVDYSSILSVASEEVESVEVFPKDELGTIDRLYNTSGVMVINTKNPVKGTKISIADFKKMLPEANLIKFRPKGFAKHREFYSPKYVNPVNTYNYNDLRTTIYWNPKVITDATGSSSLEYYNADGNGTYRAVIEGIDKGGNVVRFVYHYTVK